MIYNQSKEQIISRFLEWCEKIGYSGKDGVKLIIVDGLPMSIERPTQAIRFDIELTKGRRNATME